MKKITWKLIACLTAALLLCLPVLTGCDLLNLDLFRKASEGLEFTSNGDGTCYVSGIGTCTDSYVVIPSKSPDEEVVIGIGKIGWIENGPLIKPATAFSGQSDIKQVTIPDTVTYIGWSAFKECTGLTRVTIPDSITIISTSAFWGCTSLKNITIPDSVESIGRFAFGGCEKLIQIEDGVHYVDRWAISCEQDVVDAVLRSNTVGIGDDIFLGCEKLKSVQIPDGVTKVGDLGLSIYGTLESVVIGKGAADIVIEQIVSLDSLRHITLPINVHKELSELLHLNTSAGLEIVFTDGDGSVACIEENVFKWRANVISVTLPGCITSIGAGAFSRTGLERIVIPASVTSIGEDAFSDCSLNLTDIIVEDGNPVYHSANNCLIESGSKTLLLGCRNSDIPADGSVTSIGEGAFSMCRSLTEITIPASVTYIGGWAFSRCSSLTDVHFSGTKEQWQAIEIGGDNDPLSSATIHCTDGDITPES